MDQPTHISTPAASSGNRARRRGFLALALVVLIGALAFGAHWFIAQPQLPEHR